MRVGANDGAVLGTVHGDGGQDVRERVVSDLDVPESSFGVTDLLVSLEAVDRPDGPSRRVRAIEEIHSPDDAVQFASLYERTGEGLTSTGRLDRANSRLLDTLADPGESYADVRSRLTDRAAWLAGLVEAGRTDPAVVDRARAERLADADSAHEETTARGVRSGER
jgi:hypothetical protein